MILVSINRIIPAFVKLNVQSVSGYGSMGNVDESMVME
jgi:hypothetical protein